MSKYLLKNGLVFNEGKYFYSDILISKGRIERIGSELSSENAKEIACEGKWLMPGIIDDQVHFREPGLTHKADIYSESRAAVAGGVTSFMEMPNTNPPALTLEELEKKYMIANTASLANYSFFMGAGNNNLDEVLQTDRERVCGIKIFMGSSTGNMLVDNEKTLSAIFQNSELLIATHCEDELTIRSNEKLFRSVIGDHLPFRVHPEIRSAEACYKSSSLAIDLAKKYNSRLHILHISTLQELNLFECKPLSEKRITAEVCVHHMYFDARDYERLGAGIKCNPAIKGQDHKEALRSALKEGFLDVVATDHAPHLWSEKQNHYFSAPSGLPLVQHSLDVMRDIFGHKEDDMIFIVDKMCHAPAECFHIRERGYLREGYFADIIVFDPVTGWEVGQENIYYKCGWSPLEGKKFAGKVSKTFVSGNLAYDNGTFSPEISGERLLFH